MFKCQNEMPCRVHFAEQVGNVFVHNGNTNHKGIRVMIGMTKTKSNSTCSYIVLVYALVHLSGSDMVCSENCGPAVVVESLWKGGKRPPPPRFQPY